MVAGLLALEVFRSIARGGGPRSCRCLGCSFAPPLVVVRSCSSPFLACLVALFFFFSFFIVAVVPLVPPLAWLHGYSTGFGPEKCRFHGSWGRAFHAEGKMGLV